MELLIRRGCSAGLDAKKAFRLLVRVFYRVFVCRVMTGVGPSVVMWETSEGLKEIALLGLVMEKS